MENEPLKEELATYTSHLPELLRESGSFVLIHRTEIVSTFKSYEDAIKIGYEKFKLDPFMVKEITPQEKVFQFSRGLVCHTM